MLLFFKSGRLFDPICLLGLLFRKLFIEKNWRDIIIKVRNNKLGQTDVCVLKNHRDIEKRNGSMNLGNIDIT